MNSTTDVSFRKSNILKAVRHPSHTRRGARLVSELKKNARRSDRRARRQAAQVGRDYVSAPRLTDRIF